MAINIQENILAAGRFQEFWCRLRDAARLLFTSKGYVLVCLNRLTPTPEAPTPATFNATSYRVVPGHFAAIALVAGMHQVQQVMLQESFEPVYGRPYVPVNTYTNTPTPDAPRPQPSIH